MATIKVKYRASSAEDNDGVSFYQIIHQRKTRQLHTDYHVNPDEWNDNRSMVVTRPSSDRKSLIISIREGMGHDSEATIQIHLASLDTSGVGKANSLILKSL